MRVPEPLSTAFGAPFEELIAAFATEKGLLPEIEAVRSPRFLARSVVPHILKLSQMFNRLEKDQDSGLDEYWDKSSNRANLRLAYFLYFMPSNLYRVAAIWAELGRLGFKWDHKANPKLRAIEFGAGPASGACGIAAGERFSQPPTGLPTVGNWALIEQDQAMLKLGAEWAATYFSHVSSGDWGLRTFHRKIDFKKGLLPPSAPSFNLWVMSYFLNETELTPDDLAKLLLTTWEKHLSDEGIVILSEPALKLQSRRLLELRKALIAQIEAQNITWLKVLLPCMGHQACGALAAEDDWCHEDVSWWRPPYFKTLDKMAELDRKTLPFSYLILMKTERTLEEVLPELGEGSPHTRQRLVSPAHSEGKEREFFICGKDGKRRARYRPKGDDDPAKEISRGDILIGPQIRGDVNSSRIDSIKKVK